MTLHEAAKREEEQVCIWIVVVQSPRELLPFTIHQCLSILGLEILLD